MPRALPEWIGETPGQRAPQRVEVRVFAQHKGRCAICTRLLYIGRWALDHRQAIINGGENRETNLQPVCISPCHSDKTRDDVAIKSKTYKVVSKHIGASRRQQGFTEWRRFNGDRVRRGHRR
jgi:5-methylcytosine-specific restriction enzyme A